MSIAVDSFDKEAYGDGKADALAGRPFNSQWSEGTAGWIDYEAGYLLGEARKEGESK